MELCVCVCIKCVIIKPSLFNKEKGGSASHSFRVFSGNIRPFDFTT